MKAIKNLLEGRPWRSPLHPLLVHLPIALFPISVLLDLGSWIVSGADGLPRAALGCIVAGLATGLVAALVGVVDYTEIRADHPAKKIATRHMVLNVISLAMFGVSAYLRYRSPVLDRTETLPFILSALGLALLGYSGYLGGDLVYSDGVAVGRHRRAAPLPGRTIVAMADRTEGFVPVAEASALAEGETLRVEADGVIVTLARVQGQVRAFQEFCTHRYGPLSEGALSGCEVICPWHNSRFDVRTGKVTQGPAKVDLRTFAVQERDGKIWLEISRRPPAV